MAQQTLYFSDNFFSAGRTDIFNEAKEKVGVLDLKSAFTSGVEVIDSAGRLQVSAKFPLLGFRWAVFDNQGTEIGALREKLSFFSKKYEYQAFEREKYIIHSEAFSKEYMVYKNETDEVAKFERISGFFSSPAYRLAQITDELPMDELIAVVMGVNAIQKRRRSNSAAT
ncbi:hypothetical protein J9303_21060 [Bacillaceae bacterium Marseille-Q3522]|nr:hypothetical protein [Bacillaceae bacterium Marseille-Q3522]